MNKVTFNPAWYDQFVRSTDEKNLLVGKIAELLSGKPHGSCLEIGLGTSPYFAREIAGSFSRYVIVEPRATGEALPEGVVLINDSWENASFKETFDAIIASHVIYYFDDKKTAIEKMFRALSPGGTMTFVVNGAAADYGPLKLYFAEQIGSPYHFTYDELRRHLTGRDIKEYTVPSTIRFSSPEELFETLRLSFDNYPTEYEGLKSQLLEYFSKNVPGGTFTIDQKIIQVTK